MYSFPRYHADTLTSEDCLVEAVSLTHSYWHQEYIFPYKHLWRMITEEFKVNSKWNHGIKVRTCIQKNDTGCGTSGLETQASHCVTQINVSKYTRRTNHPFATNSFLVLFPWPFIFFNQWPHFLQVCPSSFYKRMEKRTAHMLIRQIFQMDSSSLGGAVISI